MKDRWIKCISKSGTLRGVAIRATDLVCDLSKRQKLNPSGNQALGEALLGGLLIGSFCKPGEHINLNIRGEGFCKQALVDAYPDGTVRGYVIERDLTKDVKKPEVIASQTFSTPAGEFVLDFSLDEDLSAIGPWGTGMLSVLRTKGTEKKQPYIGTVPMITGHLAKDLTFYWLQSEQIPSAVGIIVNQDPSGQVLSAGGFMLQAMPGAAPEEIKEIEAQVKTLKDLAQEIALDRDPIHLISKFFQNMPFMILEEKDLSWKCQCSMEKVEKALALIGVQELEDMLAKEGEAVIQCEFCSTEYKADQEMLKQLIQRVQARS
jgi:molecular chaperone Hsp33